MSKKCPLSQNDEIAPYTKEKTSQWPISSPSRTDTDFSRKRKKRVHSFIVPKNQTLINDFYPLSISNSHSRSEIDSVRKKLFKECWNDKDTAVENDLKYFVQQMPSTAFIAHKKDCCRKVFKYSQEVYEADIRKSNIGVTSTSNNTLERDINATIALPQSNDIDMCMDTQIPSAFETQEKIDHQEHASWFQSANYINPDESNVDVMSISNDTLERDVNATVALPLLNDMCMDKQIPSAFETQKDIYHYEHASCFQSADNINYDESNIGLTSTSNDTLERNINATVALPQSNEMDMCIDAQIPSAFETQEKFDHQGHASCFQSADNINYDESVTVKRMKQSLVDSFWGLANQLCFPEAVDYISMIPFYYPPSDLLNFVLHKILLESEEEHTAFKALTYALQLLSLYPPLNSSRQKYYLAALVPKHKEDIKSTWNALSKIIRCCFRKCAIYSTKGEENAQTCHLHCLYLLKFFVNVVREDLHIFANRSYLTPEKNISMKHSLICQLFWPAGIIGVMNSSCRSLLEFLNCMFQQNIEGKKLELLEQLQQILCLFAECVRLQFRCSETDALHCLQIKEITEDIFIYCEDAVVNVEKLQFFLMGITIKWLKIKFCECIITRIVYKTWPMFDTYKPLILRKIVRQYMFPVKSVLNQIQKDNETMEKIKFLPLKKMTALHKACFKDEIGTLSKLIDDDPGINLTVRDKYGLTPLHYACYQNYYVCASILVSSHQKLRDSESSQDILFAANNNGSTPLHFAVQSDNIDIAELLLDHGGKEAADVKNCFDLSPRNIAMRNHNPNMIRLFEKYAPTAEPLNSSPGVKLDREIEDMLTKYSPPMCTSKEVPVYLHSLYVLILDYLSIFNLPELHQKCEGSFKNMLYKLVENHLIKKWQRKPNNCEIFARCDDLLLMTQLSNIIHAFSDSLTEKMVDVDINNELLCMKLLTLMCR